MISVHQSLRVLKVVRLAHQLELLRIHCLVAVKSVCLALDATPASFLLLGWSDLVRTGVGVLKGGFPLMDDLDSPLRGLVITH